jgi:hypothetical protein
MDLGLFEHFCDFLKGLLNGDGITKLNSLLQKAQIPGVSKSHRIRSFATDTSNKLNGGDVALLIGPLTWAWGKIFKNSGFLKSSFLKECEASRKAKKQSGLISTIQIESYF